MEGTDERSGHRSGARRPAESVTASPSPCAVVLRESQSAVCRLHKGITVGLLDRLDPHAKLSGFTAKDPAPPGA